ncbi:leucine-rich repeat-containing protein 57 [Sarcoptes scabiei]|uniref:Uncharacterized protein n=1 Tax=Sarcoptes scabiei TaxID=52283 RepID=A0A132A073_SARSC|nr:hypothetical protein QR98_0027700 [Sarcoptes scabiei]UXI15024.1 leucine-rich repeat-containing protein 57 [Sarcoptes scabiei]
MKSILEVKFKERRIQTHIHIHTTCARDKEMSCVAIKHFLPLANLLNFQYLANSKMKTEFEQ